MMTPNEKYLQDPVYARLVDVLTACINECKLSPAEVREAAMFASIKHEMFASMKHEMFTMRLFDIFIKDIENFELHTKLQKIYVEINTLSDQK